MDLLRTPDERFVDLPAYPFQPRYVDVDGIRVHYLDEGPRDSHPVLLLHGEPSWSYLYRKVVPVLAAAGHRVVAPDLPGFGRSDKPARASDYTYAGLVAWAGKIVSLLDLRSITLVAHDWGGLIGLRLVAEDQDRFARVVATNTGLPTGDHPMPEIWHAFRAHITAAPDIHVGGLVASGCATRVPPEIVAAYDAPFPDESFKVGPRTLPTLLPTTPDDPAAEANRAAWKALAEWRKPFVTVYGARDPITRGADRLFHELVPGARDQPHSIIEGAGHFIQEDAGEELARRINAFLARG